MEQNNEKDELVAELLSEGFDLDKIEKAYLKSRTKTIESLRNLLTTEDEELEEEVSEPITDMVNQQLSSDLQAMGFSKNVAEKSLFLTQNKSLDQALDYIDQHSNDQDFEEVLMVVKKVGKKGEKVVKQAQEYTEEEKKQKLRELQQKARDNRVRKEEEAVQEAEKNRLKQTKDSQISQQKSAEVNMKIEFEMRRKEKAADEAYKNKLLEQMERDRQERFNIKDKQGINKTQPQQKQELSGLALIQLNIDQINLAHPEQLLPGLANNCFNTLKLYLQNIIKTPSEDKFRKINTNNARFKAQVAGTVSGVSLLNNLGFREDQEGYLVLGKDFDQKLVEQALGLVSQQIKQ